MFHIASYQEYTIIDVISPTQRIHGSMWAARSRRDLKANLEATHTLTLRSHVSF